MARGKLRLYLGAAPGVGKTFAMLNEGWRRHERGTDVVIAVVETHGRTNTAAQIRDLELVPRKTLEYRGQRFEEMDVDAVLARRPQVALVDELAHTNVVGSRNQKRWQDVEEILDAGIDVISTVNLQHLESVNDVVETITGVAQRETIPDAAVRKADQIELVDMAPEALRRRLAHGNVYPAERIDAALANFFRPGNLAALRELALLWVADRVEDELHDYRERHGIQGKWETKERVVVSLTGAPGGDDLVRRAGRMATRAKAELVGVHVRLDTGEAARGSEVMAYHRALLEELGGRYVEVVGSDVPKALVSVARAENATQLVIGASRRSRWAHLVRGSVVNGAIRAAAGQIDVHVIGNNEEPGRARGPKRRRNLVFAPIPRRRRVLAVVLGAVAFALLTLVLTSARSHVDLAAALSAYLLIVIAVAAVGGVWPGLIAAVVGFLLSNWYFAPPIHTFTIGDARDVLALVIFLVVAGVVSALVDQVYRRSAAAARAQSDARALARIAGRLVSSSADMLPELLGEFVTTFRQRGAAVVDQEGGGWRIVASAGTEIPKGPGDANTTLPLTDNELLVLKGPSLPAEDREILAGFAAQLSAAIESTRLHAEAAGTDALVRANELRTALLAAVSHDLRTPLASIKAATSSLLSDDVEFGPEETTALLETVESEADRLDVLVENLLDMSRVQTGSLEVTCRDVGIGEIVEAALSSLGARGREVEVDIDDGLPLLHVDPVLLERAVANLVDNALVHGRGRGVRVEAGAVPGQLDLRVVDRGPGIPAAQRELVFRPFQRLGDAPLARDEETRARNHTGVGLGLAVARGFVDSMGGELTAEDTPGGGATMVLRLPLAVTGNGAASAASAASATSTDAGDTPR
ncbi:MAG TPA: ATP-binding protein [Acidimicrobiales bacterium]|nr:ATP-binding protein [Acidimicrobiales bacterium]